jgi:hypothetical protein
MRERRGYPRPSDAAQPAAQALIHVALTGPNLLHRPCKFLWSRILEQVAGRASLDRSRHDMRVEMHAEHQNRHLRIV